MRLRSFAFLGFMLLVAMAPSMASAQPQPLDRIVAVVNKDAIMQSQLEDRVTQVRRQMASRNVPAPNEADLRRQVLDRMILEQIQLQMAERANLSIDDTQLNATVRGIAEDNGMTMDEFADALEEDGMSLASMREQVRREMLLRQVQQSQVASRVNVTDREVERYLDQQGETADTAYHLAHILVSVPESPTPEQVEQAQAKVRDLYRQLQSGANFAQLATAESDGQQALEAHGRIPAPGAGTSRVPGAVEQGDAHDLDLDRLGRSVDVEQAGRVARIVGVVGVRIGDVGR